MPRTRPAVPLRDATGDVPVELSEHVNRRDLDVAVVLCVHAGADPGHFQAALESMRAQTYGGARLYVYCDGPLRAQHDAVLSSQLHIEPGRDVVVRGDRSRGLAHGLNVLIDLALEDPRIRYLARMDADDLSAPDRIAKQVDHLERNEQVDVLGTWCHEFQDPGIVLFDKKMPTDHGELRQFMRYRSPLIHPSVMFRRRVFERGFRYDPDLKFMQDYDLWSRLVIAGITLANVPEYLLWFRVDRSLYKRRAGLSRVLKELSMRIEFAKATGQHSLLNYPAYAGFFTLRLAPGSIKELGYRHFRRL